MNISKYVALVLGLVLMVISARVSLHLPIGAAGIPISGQSFVVLLLGYFYPIKNVVIVLLTYLILGVVGLPVFADGACGWSVIQGNSGGYLYSFPLAAALISKWEYMQNNQLTHVFHSFAFGTIVILLIGGAHLATKIGISDAINFGIKPFLAGGLIKIGLALLVVAIHRKWILGVGR